MASYSLVFQPAVHKDLRRLPKRAIARVMARIEGLAINPLPPRVVRLSETERLYRLRVGDYRIVYEVDAEASPASPGCVPCDLRTGGAIVGLSRLKRERAGAG
jgi:mRNA interferase RelE/StbE